MVPWRWKRSYTVGVILVFHDFPDTRPFEDEASVTTLDIVLTSEEDPTLITICRQVPASPYADVNYAHNCIYIGR